MENTKFFYRRTSLVRVLLGFVLFLFYVSANAIVIEYTLEDLGSNNYTYHYSVTNDGSLGAVEVTGFQIDFDPELYNELSLIGDAPATWSSIFLGSFPPFFPAQYDACAGWCDGSGGLAVGDTLAGFSVSFEWLGGAEGPGGQAFSIYDAATFDYLEFGVTTLKIIESVPEPATLPLLLIGLSGLFFAWRRQTGKTGAVRRA